MPAFVFAPADNPMYLSKVGNWVITFISDAQTQPVRLAMTYVIPRQQDHGMQPRRIEIEQATTPHAWDIQSLECYDAEQSKDTLLDVNSEQASEFFQNILLEFQKYDVEMTIE